MKFRLFENRSSYPQSSNCGDTQIKKFDSREQRISQSRAVLVQDAHETIWKKQKNLPPIIPPSSPKHCCSTMNPSPNTNTVRSLTTSRLRQSPSHLSTGLRRSPSSPTTTAHHSAHKSDPTFLNKPNESRCEVNNITSNRSRSWFIQRYSSLAVGANDITTTPIVTTVTCDNFPIRYDDCRDVDVINPSSIILRNEALMQPVSNIAPNTVDELSITSSSSTLLFKNGHLYSV